MANFGTSLLKISNSIISGNAGGGVISGVGRYYQYTPGPVVISNSSVSNNYGPGVDSFGTLTISASTVSHNVNGGVSANQLTMNDCSIVDNHGKFGGTGGISVGDGTLTNCTISGNSTVTYFSYHGYGGGMNIGGDVTILNCTISGNSADQSGGGIYVGDLATVTLDDTTISANTAMQGGGISSNTTNVTLANSIVAGNTFLTGGSDADVSGTFTSLGHNLISQTDGSSGWLPSDLTGTSAHPLDPKLSPLANHGGPTPTQLPLAGSPAIGGGSVSLIPKGLTTDQRGKPRVVSGKVDIGAVEVQPNEAV